MNTVIDGVRDQVSGYMDINFDEINDKVCPSYDSNGSPEGPEVVKDTDDESRGWRLSTLLSRKSTKNGYDRLRNNLTKELKLSKDSIPSYYHFTKRRPKTEYFILIPRNKMYDDIETDALNVPSSEYRFRSYLDQGTNEADIEVRNNKIMSAKISGTYVDHLQGIIEKMWIITMI